MQSLVWISVCSLSLWLFASAAVLTGAHTVLNLLLPCTNLHEKSDFLEVLIAIVSSANSLY